MFSNFPKLQLRLILAACAFATFATASHARQCMEFVGLGEYFDPTGPLAAPLLAGNLKSMMSADVKIEWYDPDDIQFTADALNEVVRVTADNTQPYKTETFQAGVGGTSCNSREFSDDVVVIKLVPNKTASFLSAASQSLALATVAQFCSPCTDLLLTVQKAKGELDDVAGDSGLSLTFDVQFNSSDDIEILFVGIPGHYREFEYHSIVPPVKINQNLSSTVVRLGDNNTMAHEDLTDRQERQFEKIANRKYVGSPVKTTYPNVTVGWCMDLCLRDQPQHCQGINYYFSASSATDSNSYDLPFVCEVFTDAVAEMAVNFEACTQPGKVTKAEVVSYFRINNLKEGDAKLCEK